VKLGFKRFGASGRLCPLSVVVTRKRSRMVVEIAVATLGLRGGPH
jgi:hypothetical protein